MERCRNCKDAHGRLVQVLAAYWGNTSDYVLVCADEQSCWSSQLIDQLSRGDIGLDRLAEIERLS